MSRSKIWLSSPHMGGTELNYIHHAFDKNWIAPLGDNVNGFEEDLANYTGTNHAAVLTSGTAAIHLALILLGVEAGDEVLCQCFTFSATANPIRYQGAVPVFIDSEMQTWNMDPDLLEEAIEDRIKKGKKPKAIIAVHLYGMPAQMSRIMEISRKYEIPVIEDAAEALGSKIEGKMCGSFGDFGILSFNGNKIITTSGGGALIANNAEQIKKARYLATQARDPAPWYQHSEVGYNYRMSNIVAGIGRGQMEVLDSRVISRRENYNFYQKELNLNDFTPDILDNQLNSTLGFRNGLYDLCEPAGYFSNRWLTTIYINPSETNGKNWQDIYNACNNEQIETRPLWKPMHKQPVFADCPTYLNGVSEKLFENGLCLPSGSNLTMDDRMRVINVIRNALE